MILIEVMQRINVSLFTGTFIFLSRVSMHTHAERDIVLPVLSVCPSVQCRYCVKMNGHFVTLF